MEKQMLMLVLLFLQILSPTYGSPVAEAEADPNIIINVEQIIGNYAGGADAYGLEEAAEKETDDHEDAESSKMSYFYPTVASGISLDDHEDAESCSNWSYPSTNWSTICPDYCAGTRQSPINIEMNGAVMESDRLFYTNYDKTIPTVNIKNNGHSATVSWNTSVNTPSISGGGLNGSYTLAQLHFHWGCENTRGSEHTVDGQSYAMEMHLVHYKTSYGSLGEAIKYSDGLAVLGLFFNVGAENPAYSPITDSLSQITEPGTDEDIVFNMTLVDLLPSNDQEFFRYEGSLTTPTCNEVVIWSVWVVQVEIDQDQIDAFRSMKDVHHASLCDNYREVQPLNGRTIGVYNA